MLAKVHVLLAHEANRFGEAAMSVGGELLFTFVFLPCGIGVASQAKYFERRMSRRTNCTIIRSISMVTKARKLSGQMSHSVAAYNE